MPITMVIVDDHPVLLQGLQALFVQQDDITPVACCASSAEAVEAVGRLRPDILLLDLKMKGLSGLDVLRQLNERDVSCRTVILTAAASDEEVASALSLGVAGLIFKDAAPDDVVKGVRHVAQGRSWIDCDILRRALAFDPSRGRRAVAPETTLTPRELEIIKLVADGLHNKEIAERLKITHGTVKIHLHNIYDKLGVNDRLELVLAAQHKHLV